MIREETYRGDDEGNVVNVGIEHIELDGIRILIHSQSLQRLIHLHRLELIYDRDVSYVIQQISQ